MTHHTYTYHHHKTFIHQTFTFILSLQRYDDLSSAFLKSMLFCCVYSYVFMALSFFLSVYVVLRPFNIYFGTMDSFSGFV